MAEVARSFPPIVDSNATVLVLGSMPGTRSLRAGQYYAHPHNFFWPFIEAILGVPHTLPYPERITALQTAGVALWDTLQECEREGSLDAAIVPASEIPNDFAWLLSTYPAITRICFNGSKSATAFARHVQPTLAPEVLAALTLIPLPSTSPANRSIATGDKLARWQAALRPST